MAAPHKAAWDGLTLDTSLSVTQLVNMIHQSALESTGDIEHGRFRLHLEHETPLESEWRVAGYANSLEKFLVFTLQLAERAGRTELTSTITWYVTHKEPGKGIFAGKTVVMSAHHVYMQFLRNLAQQTLAADPGARVDIRDIDQGVPADPGAGAPPPPPPISTGLPTGQPLPPPPPPGPSLAPPSPPSPPSLLAGRVLPPPPPPPGPSLGPPPLPPGLPLGHVPAASVGTPLPPVAPRLGRVHGGGGLVTSVPGIGPRATDPNAPPVVPPPLPPRASAAPPPLPPAMPLSPAQPTPLSPTPTSVPRDTTMGTWHPGFDDDARTALEAEAELNSNDNTMLGVPGNSSNRTLELHVEGREPIPLLGPIVLGRDPVAPSISISAQPTPLEDSAMSLSKTHTLIEPSAAGATITDLHSTNGTFLLLAGGQDERLEPGVARHLEVGQPIRIGKLRVQLYRR